MSEKNSYKDAFIGWEVMHRDASDLAQQLKAVNAFKGIVAITRGGMVPACLVAQELGIKRIETLCISSYDYQDQAKASILSKPDIEDEGAGWLVIDDLVDSGKTFAIARDLYPKASFVCLYAKPDGRDKSDLFIHEFAQDIWIHFPWESSHEE